MDTVGLAGVGTMGYCAAETLIQAGYVVFAYDLNSKSLDRTKKLGAEIVTNPSEIASKTKIILMFLPGPKEVESCVLGSDGLLSVAGPEHIIVDLSTVDPDTTLRMSKAAQAKKVGYLDAPVLGRPSAVSNWALPVGGEDRHLERCRPVLEQIASKIIPAGKSGTGNRIKLLNQLMFGAINAMTAEMMAISDKMGIPPKTLYETITSSQAGTVSNLFRELGEKICSEQYSEASFTVDLLVKDVKLAVKMASDSQAPPLLGRIIEAINETARVQGHGQQDTAVMWKTFQKMWGGKGE